MTITCVETATTRIRAANGIDYAYRELGESEVPLLLFQHFRGNLANWYPAPIDALAASGRVVTFDNAGVASSSGATPSTIRQMAQDAIAFLDAMAYDLSTCSASRSGASSPRSSRPPRTRSAARSSAVRATWRHRHARVGT